MRKSFKVDDTMVKLALCLTEQDRLVLVAYLFDFLDEAVEERKRGNNNLSDSWLKDKALELFGTMARVAIYVKQHLDKDERIETGDGIKTEKELIAHLKQYNKKRK